MTTITSTVPVRTPSSPAPASAFVIFEGGDQRTVFRGVDWHSYNQLSLATGERGCIRLIYDGKDLEIMVIGNPHEYYKGLLIKIVNAVMTGLDLDYVDCGQTTWKTELRGLEADLSYYFEPGKVRVARESLARMSMDSADYPYPDLAIEIDMSPTQVDRPAIYREIGVTEVWRLVRAQELIIEQLGADGSYVPVEQSRFLHIRAEDILPWLNDAATEHPASWNRRLTDWAMERGRRA
ncbi:MAG: Uma2 family endonuclease [Isosphaeraceae bacterium]